VRAAAGPPARSPTPHPAAALERAEADLACLWLIPRGSRWDQAHFCHGSPPAANRWPIDCVLCRDGSGPILVLGRAAPALPDMPADPVADAACRAAATYLQRHGRHPTAAGLACPRCASTHPR